MENNKILVNSSDYNIIYKALDTLYVISRLSLLNPELSEDIDENLDDMRDNIRYIMRKLTIEN